MQSQIQTETIAIAMSGGVDSSTVAAMLHAQGHTVVGLTLQLWNQRRLAGREGMPESVQGRCCSIDDVYDARRVAEHLGIPYYLVNAQDRFEAEVVRPFVSEYLAGRTPIPCTLCNNHLKFDQLLATARQIGAEKIATGHYARNRFDPERQRWILSRPSDRSKDQTYFLFGLTQEQLSRTLFPLGELQKPVVREMAADAGLALAAKPDSQEICFIPGGSYSQFLKAYLDEQGRELPDSPASSSPLAPAKFSAITRAFTASPSASARVSASARPTRSTSSKSTLTHTASRSARTPISTRVPCALIASTGSPLRRPPSPSASASRSVTATSPLPRLCASSMTTRLRPFSTSRSAPSRQASPLSSIRTTRSPAAAGSSSRKASSASSRPSLSRQSWSYNAMVRRAAACRRL